MKRILLLTDSLAMPREEPELTLYEDTYPYLLRKKYEVFQFSKGGGLMKEFVEQTFYYNQFRPDIVILQIGIVDCAPRAFSKFEEEVFNSNRLFCFLRRKLSQTGLTKRIRNIRRISWTSKDDFSRGCIFLQGKFSHSKVFALSIVPSTTEYEEKVPGISKKISEYNDILKSVFKSNYIDLSEIPSDGIMSDHHHLTAKGHLFVYEKIEMALDKEV